MKKNLIVFILFLFVGFYMKAFVLKSNSFKNGEFLDKKFTCEGSNISPGLSWEGVPKDTQSFALICDDPDAPKETPWVHWVIFNIPESYNFLSEGISKNRALENGIIQGINDSKKIGYDGPCPPKGKPHRYFFKIYALDTKLALGGEVTKDELLKNIQGHILGKAELIGLYQIS